MHKFALVHIGNEESYGLLFVAGELKRLGYEYKWFDSYENGVANKVMEYAPDFVCFSPMTTFYEQARILAKMINLPTIFGGHHAMATPETVESDCVIVGTCVGAMERIVNGKRGIIKSVLKDVNDLPFPDRDSYYRDIPRMATRYRKIMLSTLGCPWACTYCSSSMPNTIARLGTECSKVYLQHRSIDTLIAEAKNILQYPTHEIEWVDDDVLHGDESWLIEFTDRWKKEIGLPMYTSTTSINAVKKSLLHIKSLSNICKCIGLGIQSTQNDSLLLLGRSWDNLNQQKAAYQRLVSFGFRVNLQAIIGLPVSEPVEEAIQTVSTMSKFGHGSICSVYPLQVYPGTAMLKYCNDNSYELNNNCIGDTNTGVTGIKFDEVTTKRIRNLCKIATMAVKYGLSEEWIRALIDIDYNETVSKNLSLLRYKECIKDRLPDKGTELFNEIVKTTKVKY